MLPVVIFHYNTRKEPAMLGSLLSIHLATDCKI